jgi:hypothetical protein
MQARINVIDPMKAFNGILGYVTPEAMRRGDMAVLIAAVRDELSAPKAGTTDTAALETEVTILRDRVASLEVLLEHADFSQPVRREDISVLPPAPKKGRKKTSDNE